MTSGGNQLLVGEKEAKESGYKRYYPPELVGNHDDESDRLYYRYLIHLQQEFNCTVQPQDIVLAVRTNLGSEVENSTFDLDVDGGKLIVNVKYNGRITLTAEEVRLCQRFQTTVFKYLFRNNLKEDVGTSHTMMDCMTFDYLLLPTRASPPRVDIDWDCIECTLFENKDKRDMHIGCSPPNCRGHPVHTKNGPVCTCVLENSFVRTPHSGLVYCINGTVGGLCGTSILKLKGREFVTYKDYYLKKHGITLRYENEVLLNGRPIFRVRNCLRKSNRNETSRERGKATFELPPELCLIILSPISISTFYSFSILPSIIHRIESLLLAVNLIRMDHCMQNVNIPAIKVLEAITTKKCQEKFDLESLEILGDSFLKYATGRQVFKTYQDDDEGLLTTKKEKMISNDTLCKLGCDRKIPGFIRDGLFDPKKWIVPGGNSSSRGLDEEVLSCTKVYLKKENRTLEAKVIADVVEALIGAFLSTGGEKAAISFMAWVGINVDDNTEAYIRPVPMNPEKHVNVSDLESLLNYRFRDITYLAEALTHGSYKRLGIPGSYQRLEFLGDSVLDYVITEYLYKEYPGLSQGMLTDLRSASVNNDRYALAAIIAGLHTHILHASRDLQRAINKAVRNSKDLSLVSTFGWESEITYPKVLGDVIESLAGAVYVDSGYNKEIVFRSIRPLLEPMITPDMLRLHPVRELNELCQKENFTLTLNDHVVGVSFVEVEVKAYGKVFKVSRSASNKDTAKSLACKAMLNELKGSALAEGSGVGSALAEGSGVGSSLAGGGDGPIGGGEGGPWGSRDRQLFGGFFF